MSTFEARVSLPADLLQALGDHTGLFWSEPALEPFICEAIRAWMKPPPAIQAQPAVASGAGYQWKQVFLPEGTRLRASFGCQPLFAVVEGAQVKYGEQSISPSCFANLRGSGNRNAWKTIWLRLPGSDEWLLADVYRSARKSAIARMFGGDAPVAKPRSRPAPRARQENSRQPALRPARASGMDARKRAPVLSPPVARLSGSLQTEVRPSSGSDAAHGNGAQRNKFPDIRDEPFLSNGVRPA